MAARGSAAGMLLLLAGAGACNPFTGVDCTLSIEPAVTVVIRDAETGVPRAADARGAVSDGSYVDSLRPAVFDGEGTMLSRAAADERVGRYDVVVEHEGYAVWRGTAFVRRGSCGAQPVTLVAELEPAGSARLQIPGHGSAHAVR